MLVNARSHCTKSIGPRRPLSARHEIEVVKMQLAQPAFDGGHRDLLKIRATEISINWAADRTACTKLITILGGREMPVSILSRWTAKQEDVVRIGRKVKSFYEKHGAE